MTGLPPLPLEEFAREEGFRAHYGCVAGAGVYGVEPVHEPLNGWVLLIHGLCEHPGRFFHLARLLGRRGLAVAMPVLAGHGHDPEHFSEYRPFQEEAFRCEEISSLAQFFHSQSVRHREGLRHLHQSRWRRQHQLQMSDHLAELQSVVESLRLHFDRAPDLILGHSLGGLLASAMGRRLAENPRLRPRAVTLINPALQPIGHHALDARAVEWSWKWRDRSLFRPGGVLYRLAAFTRCTLNVAWSSEWVSDLPEQVALHQADSLNLRRVSSGYLLAIQALMAEMAADRLAYPVPVFLTASGGDQIVHGAGSREFGRRLMEDAAAGHCVLFFEEAFAHDLTRSARWSQIRPRWEAWLEEQAIGAGQV